MTAEGSGKGTLVNLTLNFDGQRIFSGTSYSRTSPSCGALSLSSSEIPHSMVIDHPAFHQYPKEATTFMILKGTNRTGDGLGNFSEAQGAFPYPRQTRPGAVCSS